MTVLDLEMIRTIRKAIMENNITYIQKFFRDNPELLNYDTATGTWLNIAIAYKQKEIIQYLISLGADVNYGGKDEPTPINKAVMAGSLDIIKMLVENGANIETDAALENPLFSAILQKNAEIVGYFLMQDIDVTIKYLLNYGEVDALKFAKIWSTSEIVSLIENQFIKLGISLPDIDKKIEKNLDQRKLKKKIDFALRQVVSEWRGAHWGTEEIFAMSFHMDYNNKDIKKRFSCTIMIQTKAGCEEGKYANFDTQDTLTLKYAPKGYKYKEEWSGFQRVQEYLTENCICLEACEALEDIEAREKMQEDINNQILLIKKIMIQCIKRLRKEQFLTSDYHSKEFYVFPYLENDYCTKEDILFAKAVNEGLDLTEYLAYIKRTKNVNIDVFEPESTENEKKEIQLRKISKRGLKKKLDAAIRQMVETCLEKYDKEGLYAMCFWMHYDSIDIESRFLCEIIVQTERGYEEAVQRFMEEQLEEDYQKESLLYYKYLPDEYKYSLYGLDKFQIVQTYLYTNCLNLEECKDLEDFEEREQMYENIARQSLEIEKILAETMAELRQKKVLRTYNGTEFYVFPYIEEDTPAQKYISLTRKMNKGLDLTEYLEFMKSEFSK